MTDTERLHDLFLIVDNQPDVCARVLHQHRMNPDDSEGEAIQRYLKVQARSDHQKYDPTHTEGRRMLRAAMREIENPAVFWRAVAAHYKDQHNEGNRLFSYLPQELRALETS